MLHSGWGNRLGIERGEWGVGNGKWEVGSGEVGKWGAAKQTGYGDEGMRVTRI